jgi:hypothetical protein
LDSGEILKNGRCIQKQSIDSSRSQLNKFRSSLDAFGYLSVQDDLGKMIWAR